jgi:hypothetical protein
MEASGTSRLRFTPGVRSRRDRPGQNGISVCLEQLPFVEKPCLRDRFMRWMVAKSRTSALPISYDISLCRERRSGSESPDKFCRCEESGESGCPRCVEDGGDLTRLPFPHRSTKYLPSESTSSRVATQTWSRRTRPLLLTRGYRFILNYVN